MHVALLFIRQEVPFGSQVILVFSSLFGQVHGHIRPANKHIRILAMVRVQGNSDTGTDLTTVTACCKFILHHSADFFCHPAGHSARSYFRQSDEKFITAPATEDVGVTEMDPENGGKIDEQSIPGLVAVAVVDPFEVIQIKKEDRCFFLVSSGPANILFEQVMEHPSVGQVGQGIMVGQIL